MSAFAENPFFFFVDNVSPIPSVNNSKNARRIVELSDTGCDARLSVSSLLRNATRYYSSKSAKMRSNGNWRPGYEERFRAKYGANYDGLYFIPKEAETEQNRWREYPAYENTDFRVNSRITPEKIRYSTRYVHVPNNFTNRSQLPRFNHPKSSSEMHDHGAFYHRGRMSAAYPDNLKESPRKPNSHDEYCQRGYEASYDSVSHDFATYNSKKMSGDRGKRTHPSPKVFYENAESQYDVRTFQNSGSMTSEENRSTEKFKRFVDRAVDKDSLSDILESNVSAESPVVKKEENKVRNSFWEFISLDDDDDRKTARPPWPLKTKRDLKPINKLDQKSIPNIPSNNVSEDSDDKVGINVMGKTIASLKRKLEKPKLEEPVSQSPPLPIEKKIRSEGSRLPVRIGGRLRSKNPIATRIRSNLKGYMTGKEENKELNALDSNSARSRTKPKEKPSVLQSEIIVGPFEVAEYSKSEGNVQEITNIDSYLSRNQKGDQNIIENEKLAACDDNNVIGGLKMINITGDQRRNEIGSAGARKMSLKNNVTKNMNTPRVGLKENCFFHLHDEENIVCNTHCKKDCKKSYCLETRKPVAIKSRL